GSEIPDNTAHAVPARGDRLVSASIGDATTLIPMLAGDAASQDVAGQLYLPLLKYDKNLNLVGQLAESWQVSKDNLTLTFHLRPGLRWTDGKPFTSADCLFTLKLMQDAHTQSPFKSDYDKITHFEAPDALTFVVHYAEPFSPALSTWASLAILPAHVFKGVDIMNTPLSRHPEATIGPYTLKAWEAQQSILMRANPGYYDGPVWITERLTRIIPDTSTQFLELAAGHLDSMNLTPIQYRRLFDTKPTLRRDYKRYRYLGFGYTYLGFNLKRPPFDDARVRRAITYAIDRQEIVDGVLMGLGDVIATPYKPGTYWVDTSIRPRPYDPQKAKQLLAEAGWTDHDGDGLIDKDGRPFRFTILTNNGNRQRADAAIIIQKRLKQVGIDVQIRLVEWSSFISNFIDTHQFDAVILGWGLSPEPDQFSIWHSSQTGPHQFNFISYANPIVDKALVDARRTFDPARRKRDYDLMQEQIHQDAPIVFLFAPYSLPVMHRRIHGIEPAPAGIGWNSEHWDVPAAEQKYHVDVETP
ncbi:MAG TPA: peptide-binding protein, partial [Mariprofundaceae bacterium]|nr:peptide-binding protein [Mariprofundaceae bacterium]